MQVREKRTCFVIKSPVGTGDSLLGSFNGKMGGRDMGWLSRLLVVAVMVGSTSLWAADGVLPGSGTEGDPYLIEDLADFDEFANSVNATTYWASGVYTRLACDPNMAGRIYATAVIAPDTPDTSYGFDGRPFKGVFAGEGHVIRNLTIDTAGADNDYLGLFGKIEGSSAEVEDLGLENINAGGDYSRYLGGLCGWDDEGTITNCYATGSVTGSSLVGGLCGDNRGTISNCYSGGSVTGGSSLGGLCGRNSGTISNCYSGDSVTGGRYSEDLGGLCGGNGGVISNCYSGGSVTGEASSRRLGGLCGSTWGEITNCFWDIETSGMTNSDGGMGLPTAQMQTLSTFVDAGWDFANIWWILEDVGYPRHLWEIPVLHGEPELTLGTINTISWEPITGEIEYYVECAEDPNFTSIVSNSGWITETSCEFIDLQLGQQYWYRVRAGNATGVETGWSNVESSLQSTLGDAVDMLLDPASLKNENVKNALLNKIDAAMAMIDEGLYEDALNKLRNDILAKTNGCAESGEPDKNDWIIACEQQSQVYGLVIETIEYVRSLME